MSRRGRGRPPHPDILTPAERRVLEELRTGGTYAEIAVRLGVSPDAIRFHVRNMRDKLNLPDRAALMAWRPADGERRRPFRALLVPLATLPSATRTVAGIAAGAVVTGAIAVAIVLVVALGRGGGSPSVVAVPGDFTATPVPVGSPEAMSTPTAKTTPVGEAASSTAPSPVATPTPSRYPAATSAVASSECAFEFRDVFDFWVVKPEYEMVPAVSSTPSPRWIGYSPGAIEDLDPGLGVHQVIAVGSVRGVERLENPSDGRFYLVLVIEVEDVLWGAATQGGVLRLLIDGSSREELNWERVESARESLLCSRALFSKLWPWGVHVQDGPAGIAVGELHEISPWDLALGPRGDRFIEDLAEAFRLAASKEQPRTCQLFSLGTGSDAGVRRTLGPWQGLSDMAAADSTIAAVVEGSIVGVMGEARVAEHVSQGPLAERYLVVEVEVGARVWGAVAPANRLRLLLPVSSTVTPERVASLLPCENALFLLKRFTGDWLRIPAPSGGGPLYILYDRGLYLETRGGGLLNPYLSWAWANWFLYGPIVLYDVNVQTAALGEFSAVLRATLANR